MTYKEECPNCFQHSKFNVAKSDYTTSDEVALWINSMRYCAGRRSYAVSEFIEMLKRHWGSLQQRTRNSLALDIVRINTSETPDTFTNEWLDLQEFMSLNMEGKTK